MGRGGRLRKISINAGKVGRGRLGWGWDVVAVRVGMRGEE